MKRLLGTGCLLALIAGPGFAVAFDETTSYVDRAFIRVDKDSVTEARNGESVPATIQVESYDAFQNRKVVRVPIRVSFPRGAELSAEDGAQIGIYNIERKTLAEVFGDYRRGGPAAKVFSASQLGYQAHFNSHGIFLSNLTSFGVGAEEGARTTASAAAMGILIAPALETDEPVSLELSGTSRNGVIRLELEQAVKEIRF